MNDITTATIPAAGEKEIILLTGKSIIILDAPDYTSFEQTPKIYFDNTSSPALPISPQNVYFSGGKFARLVLTGTSESVGDTVRILSVDQCLETRISENAYQLKRASFSDTFSVTADDTVRTLSEVQLINSDGQLPAAMYVTANGDQAHYTKGSDPTQDPAGIGHILNSGETVKIEGVEWITDFRYISGVGGGSSVLSVTLEY